MALDPNSAMTHYYAASALLPLGRFADALGHARTAVRLAPTQAEFATAVALVLVYMGRAEEAEHAARAAYALDSTYTYALTVLGDALRHDKRPREALDAYARRGPGQTGYDLVGPALARVQLGQPDEARRAATELLALGTRQNVPEDAVAMIYAHLGDRDRAFDWLQRAFASRSAALVSLATDPDWAPIRTDPRFERLRARVSMR